MWILHLVIRMLESKFITKYLYQYNTKQLDDTSFLAEIEKKLIEEVNEYSESKDIEELADLLEVIYRISELRGVNSDELDEIRKEKAEKRGKFDDNLFLIDAEKNDSD